MISDTERTRRQAMNDVFGRTVASAQDILSADFGHWPPKGLAIRPMPDMPVTFDRFFYIRPGLKGFVANATPQTIDINRWSLLPRVFNKASASLVETLSHENIHVMQNTLYGIVQYRPEDDPPHSYRDYITNIISPAYIHNNANLREVQARLHGVIAEHYRRRQVLPLNTAELWALLRVEKIVGESAYVDDLLDNTIAGRWAKERFPAGCEKRGRRMQDSADLWFFFYLMRRDKADEFCEEIMPAIYGRLLELYGDKLGCMRMDENHNLLLGETFACQAEVIETDLKKGRAPDTAAIEETILALPLSQAGCLQRDLPRHGGWSHKRSEKPVPLTPETIDLVTGLLRRQTAPR